MQDPFSVDVDQLRSAAADVGGVASDLQAVVERLRSALGRAGEPWGDDEPGLVFGARHSCDAGVLLAHLDDLAGGLGSVGDGLTVAADRYADADGASTPGGR